MKAIIDAGIDPIIFSDDEKVFATVTKNKSNDFYSVIVQDNMMYATKTAIATRCNIKTGIARAQKWIRGYEEELKAKSKEEKK